jgi:hypothetical protein
VSIVRELLVDLSRYIVELEEELIANCQSSSNPLADVHNTTLSTFPSDGAPTSVELDGSTLTTGCITEDTFLGEHLMTLTLESNHDRFFGKSSNIMLLKETLEAKKETTQEDATPSPSGTARGSGPRRPEFWAPQPVASTLCSGTLVLY